VDHRWSPVETIAVPAFKGMRPTGSHDAGMCLSDAEHHDYGSAVYPTESTPGVWEIYQFVNTQEHTTNSLFVSKGFGIPKNDTPHAQNTPLQNAHTKYPLFCGGVERVFPRMWAHTFRCSLTNQNNPKQCSRGILFPTRIAQKHGIRTHTVTLPLPYGTE